MEDAPAVLEQDATLDSIPPELKTFAHWIVWRLEERDENLTKVPYSPRTGSKASSTDSRTWATFPEALEAVESGQWDGLGFVFSSCDPFVGIDLDACRDPETGELEGWASKIIDAFPQAYKEISPSGGGVHIIVRGKISRPRKRKGLEIYSAERFFTVTGRAL